MNRVVCMCAACAVRCRCCAGPRGGGVSPSPQCAARIFPLVPQVVKAVTCQDESTTKLLIRLQDGHLVETVVMRYSHRSTVCVSSQVGCRMACRFCSTGTMGLLGHLTAGEMCEQVAPYRVHCAALTRPLPVMRVRLGGAGSVPRVA